MFTDKHPASNSIFTTLAEPTGITACCDHNMAYGHPAHTALLLFTRTREEEARAKDFSGKHRVRTNSRIAGHLIGHAERTARATGLPCFVISSHLQHGNSFGERLANAFEDIYALGFEQVIAIGNDCPSLTASDLNTAALHLEQDGVVFGPARDGGVYLIGLQHNAFQKSAFAALPWTSGSLTEALRSYATDLQISCFTGDTKSDIDHSAHLIPAFKGKPILLSLRAQLLSLIASLAPVLSDASSNPYPLSLRIYSGLRAPPAV